MSYVIGISGGSGSGKTTLAKKLYDTLTNTYLIKIDDYFIDYSKREKVKAPYCNNWYFDDNSPTSYNLSKVVDDLYRTKKTKQYQYIIVEGLFTFYDEKIYELLDYKIFIDCPDDIRIIRRITRNLSFGYKLDDILNVYIDMVRYRHEEYVKPQMNKANLIIKENYDIKGIISNIKLNEKKIIKKVN